MNTPQSAFNIGDVVNSPEGLILLTKKFYISSHDDPNWEFGWQYQYTNYGGTSYDAMLDQNYIPEFDIITIADI